MVFTHNAGLGTSAYAWLSRPWGYVHFFYTVYGLTTMGKRDESKAVESEITQQELKCGDILYA